MGFMGLMCPFRRFHFKDNPVRAVLVPAPVSGRQLRHGRGHVHSPSNVPYRANICAMKSIGVTDLIALSACGSLREDMKPGEFVIVDQFIDRTFQRSKTFFDKECFHELCVEYIFSDLIRAGYKINSVEGYFERRGGIAIIPVRTTA